MPRAATRDGFHEVDNIQTDSVSTFSGGGDRFGAAAATARVSGWSWEEALALGNACAVHYIENNSTASKRDIKRQINEKKRS
ncbi:MAG: PfkB family carbohydrate kinase [Candidatus Nanohaloarchaea archaeon]